VNQVPEAKIDNAIVNHRSWVLRFKNSIQGVTIEKFDVERASDYTTCDFGRWLYGDAKNVVASEQLQQLLDLHKSFHEVAGKIAVMINKYDESQLRVQLFGELDGLSRELINLLLALKRDMQNVRLLHLTARTGKGRRKKTDLAA